MKTNLYRKKGPKVFVSYSYKDKGEAVQIKDYLEQNSFTVQIEDETSLLGEDLTQILPQRIRDSEVFIVLLTKTSNASNWVKLEFSWAIQQKKENNLLVIPVVFDESTLPDIVKPWVYLNASHKGLTPEILDLIKVKCSTAVFPLPLDSTGYKFQKGVISSLVKDGTPKKRVILDSEGMVFSLFDDLFASLHESEYHQTMNILSLQNQG